ncbi:MAG TPA: thiamine pyrophosphate-dependent enzyme [Burkholderiales bacterium]|nr:thiamine pyrophosphate-dependent enzyme [Burkholderiales bacterium]
MTKEELFAFELQVAREFEAGNIRAPIHLSGGNEEALIDLFRLIIPSTDWVFSTYRSHYHALLHGIPRDLVMQQILAGHSMNLSFPEYRFFTSAMVGGILPIATGVALALKRLGGANVWCFVGDMAASIGAYHEASRYAACQDLPITFVVEDNGMSCDSPTSDCWGTGRFIKERRYTYERQWPHNGTGKWVNFV